jgi:hypothetical protein
LGENDVLFVVWERSAVISTVRKCRVVVSGFTDCAGHSAASVIIPMKRRKAKHMKKQELVWKKCLKVRIFVSEKDEMG